MRVVRTGNLIYAGPDRVDVSPQSGEMPGRVLAPSWALRSDALDWRLGGRDDAAWWSEFSMRYVQEARATLASDPSLLDSLLAKHEVTLVCSCARPERCHRVLLAKLLEEQRGIRYVGELTVPYLSMIEEPPTEVSRVRQGVGRSGSTGAQPAKNASTGTSGGRGDKST